mmetsp:Transcript_2828/g.4752  ORF Transcript_2828/g.4752 Transcript_2828/m.4752 type:complete len:287 (-) Transcript_2828:199-1059(-)
MPPRGRIRTIRTMLTLLLLVLLLVADDVKASIGASKKEPNEQESGTKFAPPTLNFILAAREEESAASSSSETLRAESSSAPMLELIKEPGARAEKGNRPSLHFTAGSPGGREVCGTSSGLKPAEDTLVNNADCLRVDTKAVVAQEREADQLRPTNTQTTTSEAHRRDKEDLVVVLASLLQAQMDKQAAGLEVLPAEWGEKGRELTERRWVRQEEYGEHGPAMPEVGCDVETNKMATKKKEREGMPTPEHLDYCLPSSLTIDNCFLSEEEDEPIYTCHFRCITDHSA